MDIKWRFLYPRVSIDFWVNANFTEDFMYVEKNVSNHLAMYEPKVVDIITNRTRIETSTTEKYAFEKFENYL